MEKDILILIAVFSLLGAEANHVQTCPNPHHCRNSTSGFSMFYASTTHRANEILNAPVLVTSNQSSRESCIIACLKTPPCWSVNYRNSQTSENQTCQLLQENEYLNASSILSMPGWDHHSFETDCKSNPCKNNGICIPNLASGAFVCDCRWPWTGRLCGTYRDLFSRAQGFWNFDSGVVNVGHQQLYSLTLCDGLIRRVPDRKSPVLFCFKSARRCLWGFQMPIWLSMSGPSRDAYAPYGFTISIWIKHLRDISTLELVNNYLGHINGINIVLQNHNLSARTLDWLAEVRFKTVIWKCRIVGGPHAFLWTHYALVFYPNNQGVVCYVNGIAMAKNSDRWPGTGTEDGFMTIGSRYENMAIMPSFYLNDFGFWNEPLSSEDIQVLLKRGKAT